MKKLSITLAVITLSVFVAAESKYICKVAHLGTHTVAITCTNGSDPTGKKDGDILFISCGK
jgi:hypothetical protein